MLTKFKSWIKKITYTNSPFDDLRLVISTAEEHLVTIYKLKLEEEGIPVFVINKKDSSYNSFGSIELYVHHTLVVRAKHIIEKEHE
ncbi:MAG: hypothetical protein ACPGU5_07175 [Lishizhenia sp.]